MGDAGFTTYLVDDDPAVLRSITRLLKAGGYKTRSFSSPQKFLSAHDPSVPGCAIIDLVMAELDGLRLQEALAQSGSQRPIIFLTGRGDVSTSVKAMKAGAVDFLPKPFRNSQLLQCVERALVRSAGEQNRVAERNNARQLLDLLTPREFEVMQLVVTGMLNKQIASELGTAEKTVKVHRGRVMKKLDATSVPELMRLVEMAQIASGAECGTKV